MKAAEQSDKTVDTVLVKVLQGRPKHRSNDGTLGLYGSRQQMLLVGICPTELQREDQGENGKDRRQQDQLGRYRPTETQHPPRNGTKWISYPASSSSRSRYRCRSVGSRDRPF